MTRESPDRSETRTPHIPVLLPRIRVDATHDADAFDLSTNLHRTPAGDDLQERVAAGELGGRISALVQHAQTAVRVEIHDPGGAVHADILHPPVTDTEPPSEVPGPPVDGAAPPTTGTVIDQDGWVPGEHVLVTTVVGTGQADQQGRIQLSTDELATHPGGSNGRFVLIGQSSGTVLERDPR